MGSVAGWCDQGGPDPGELCLHTVSSASVPRVSKYIYGLFLRGEFM